MTSKDYSLENTSFHQKVICDRIMIKSVAVLEVQLADVRCIKGDCAGDYPCWPICGKQEYF